MRYIFGLFLLLLIIFQTSIALFNISLISSNSRPIQVGLVYSLTGERSRSETLALKASLLAIQEINEKGGLLGRVIEPIVKDAESNWNGTMSAIEDLIQNEKVNVVFGCWTLEGRYTTKELFEKYNHLLINPYQYDGLILSGNIVNTGVSANQQVTPAVYYGLNHFGNRCFLIGTDYVYSHVLNLMIQDHVNAVGGEIVGESYLSIANDEIDTLIQSIVKAKPQIIFCSLVGKDNFYFFKKLREAGITSDRIPVISFDLDEALLQEMDNTDAEGHYASWSYFQSLANEINQNFVQKFKKYTGLQIIDNDAEAAYAGVHLWAQAVKETQTIHRQTISYALADMRFDAPEGVITLDQDGKLAWKYMRIGKINSNKQFEIVWDSSQPIRPVPYQVYRSRLEWNELIENIYLKLNKPNSEL